MAQIAAPSKSSPARASRLCSALTGRLPPLVDHIQSQLDSPVNSSVAEANSLEFAPSLSKSPKILSEPPQSGRKRKRGSEEEEPDSRQRGSSPPMNKPAIAVKRLSRKNLEEFNRRSYHEETGVFDNMPQRKRSRTQSSITDVSNDDTTTVSTSTRMSSLSLSNYRFTNLARRQIEFEHFQVPEQVQKHLDPIFQSDISEEDKQKVTAIANSLCHGFAKVMAEVLREDNSVELIARALEEMNERLLDEAFVFGRKIDWDPALKPTVQWSRYISALPAKTPSDANGALDEFSKAQQPCAGPDTSATTMQPPPIRPDQDIDSVKTPRPDITMGLDYHVVVAKLESVGVATPHSDRLLRGLQQERALTSCPAPTGALFRFPTLVVEGKAYSTGKTLYEAQNQAAVSGSMMLVMQHQLYELAGSETSDFPLAFSICSQGPVLELWLHYNIFKGSARCYKIHQIQNCHAAAFHTVVDFFLAVLRIMRWSKLTLLDNVANKLLRVWHNYQTVTV